MRIFTKLLFILVSLLSLIMAVEIRNEVRARRESGESWREADVRFRRQPPPPVHVELTSNIANGPTGLPSNKYRLPKLGKFPVVLALNGCAFPTWLKDVPRNVVFLSIYENHQHLRRRTLVEACVVQDGEGVQTALHAQLNLLIRETRGLPWVDQKRVMLMGSGEAAPIVAAYTGAAKLRMTLGEPCLVPWSQVASGASLRMLLGKTRAGLNSGPHKAVNTVAVARGHYPTPPQGVLCDGVERPKVPRGTRILVADGDIKAFDRPVSIFKAQEAAYRSLVR